MKKKSLYLLVIIILLFTNKTTYAEDRDIIKVGFYLYDSFQEIDSDGTYCGYSYDCYQQIAQYADWEYEFITGTFSECMEMLQNGEIDLMGGIDKSGYDENDFDFEYSKYIVGASKPELYALVSNHDLTFENFINFEYMIVAYLKGTTQRHLIEDYCLEHDFRVNLQEYNSPDEMELAEHTLLLDFIYTYPVEALFILFLSAILIIALLILCVVLIRVKNRKIKQSFIEQETSKNQFLLAIRQLKCYIFQYDLEEKKCVFMSKETGSSIYVTGEIRNRIASQYPTFFSLLDSISLRKNLDSEEITRILEGSKDEKKCWIRVIVSTIYDKEKPVKLIGTVEDITDEKSAELDPLTGLYNRLDIETNIAHALMTDAQLSCAFIILDIDDFKAVNDTYGHDVGDICLCHLADVLRKMFRTSDRVYRMGGDEFCIFLNNVQREDLVTKKLTALYQELAVSPVTPNELYPFEPFYIHISCGATVSVKFGCSYEILYKLADNALYNSKGNGKGHFTIV